MEKVLFYLKWVIVFLLVIGISMTSGYFVGYVIGVVETEKICKNVINRFCHPKMIKKQKPLLIPFKADI